MNINNISYGMVFTLSDLKKKQPSKQGSDVQKIKISSFSDKNCCKLLTLRAYLEKAIEVRTKKTKLLVS